MTLTKAELVDLLVGRVGLNKREARDMVDAFFEEISAALEKSNGVKLSNFGNFELREKPQRPGRNPKTGELVPISARRVVTFHASAKLKTAVESAPRHSPTPNPCTPAFSEATMSSTETAYCYHCARHHPRREMRQIETKNGKKWRCIQSIQATKKSTEQRDAFGKSVTAINTSENQARVKSRLNLERLLAGR